MSDEKEFTEGPLAIRAAVEYSYGLLWMYLGDDQKVHEARKMLLSLIGKEGQKRGIEYATSQHEMPPIEAVLHKLP